MVVTQDGEPIVHNLGSGPAPDRRAAAPEADAAAARPAAAEPAKPAAAPPKPLSRLEKLRLESQARAGAKAAGEVTRSRPMRPRPTADRPDRRSDRDDPISTTPDDREPGRIMPPMTAARWPAERLPAAAPAADPAARRPGRRRRRRLDTRLEVFPPEVNLTTARDRQSLVVQATYADGITRDVTAEATLDPGRPRPASAATGRPSTRVADGETTLARRVRRQVGRRCR